MKKLVCACVGVLLVQTSALFALEGYTYKPNPQAQETLLNKFVEKLKAKQYNAAFDVLNNVKYTTDATLPLDPVGYIAMQTPISKWPTPRAADNDGLGNYNDIVMADPGESNYMGASRNYIKENINGKEVDVPLSSPQAAFVEGIKQYYQFLYNSSINDINTHDYKDFVAHFKGTKLEKYVVASIKDMAGDRVCLNVWDNSTTAQAARCLARVEMEQQLKWGTNQFGYYGLQRVPMFENEKSVAVLNLLYKVAKKENKMDAFHIFKMRHFNTLLGIEKSVVHSELPTKDAAYSMEIFVTGHVGKKYDPWAAYAIKSPKNHKLTTWQMERVSYLHQQCVDGEFQGVARGDCRKFIESARTYGFSQISEQELKNTLQNNLQHPRTASDGAIWPSK